MCYRTPKCHIASHRRDEYVNTLMLQDGLAENEWFRLLSSEDYRGLTPLLWGRITMHGEFTLNMNSRLDLGQTRP